MPSRSLGALSFCLAVIALASCKNTVSPPEPPPGEGPLPAPVEPKATLPPNDETIRESAKSAAEKMADPEAVPDPKPVAPAGAGGWRPAKMSLKDFGAKLGGRIAQVKGVEGKALVRIKTPEGEGNMELKYAFATPTKYRFEYVEPSLIPSRAIVISNGVQKVEFKHKKFGQPVPIASPLGSGSAAPNEWIRSFSRLMFVRLTDNRDSLGELVKLLTADKGMTVNVEERTLERNGKKVHNYRIRVERTPAAAAKAGPMRFEIVVDGARWMPVTVRTESGSDKKLWKYEWSCGWNFGKTFPEENFIIRKSTPQ